jgi:hypothetical protein
MGWIYFHYRNREYSEVMNSISANKVEKVRPTKVLEDKIWSFPFSGYGDLIREGDGLVKAARRPQTTSPKAIAVLFEAR